MDKVKNIGLRGVTVADTRISNVDGENGILVYRGFHIEELARSSSFEETAYLLLYDALPNRQQLEEFKSKLAGERRVPVFIFESFRQLPVIAQPMDILQASIPLLATDDPDLELETREAIIAKAVRLIAHMPVLVAGWDRIRKGLEPIPHDNTLSHAGNFLWQLTGRQPDAETSRDLDTALLL